MPSNAKKTAHTEGIRAWSTAIVVCFGLMLGLVSTGYGLVIGNFENPDSNDGWVPGQDDATAILVSGSSTGVTRDHGSLQLTPDNTGFWDLQYNFPAVPLFLTNTKLQFDLTMIASEWPSQPWTEVAAKIALNSDGASGWKEWTNTTAIDRNTGLQASLDWGAWAGDAAKTYTLDISDYDLTGATYLQLIISVQENSGDLGVGHFYFDNIRLVTPLSPLHVEGNKIKDANEHVVTLRGLGTIDIGMLKEWYDINGFIDRVTNKSDPNSNSPGWYPKVIRYLVCPNDSYVTNSPLVFNPLNPDDPNNELVYEALKQAADYDKENGVYTIICLREQDFIHNKIAEANAVWDYMSNKFADDPNVLFELFDEPKDTGSSGWTTVKTNMQTLVNTVRAHAPHNLVLVAGTDFAQGIANAATDPINDPNVVYSAHVYPATWLGSGGQAWITTQNITPCAAVHPVIMTAWGFDSNDVNSWCYGTVDNFGQPLLDYLEGLGVGSVAVWAAANWEPHMFDPNWQLVAGEGAFGGFVKDWLYEKRNADRIVTLTTKKCTVTAGKIQGQDAITASGTFSNCSPDLSKLSEIIVTITSLADGNVIHTEPLDINSSTSKVSSSKGTLSYTHKIPKGGSGAITALALNFNKRTFSLSSKSINLTGLACPLQLTFNMGYYTLTGDVNEAIVNGPKTLIPTRLMRLYKDTLIVDKAKAKHNSKKASSDTLSVTGDIAVEDMNLNTNEPNLVTKNVVLAWGDQNGTPTKTLTIPGNVTPALASFKASKTGHVYKCSKIHPAEDPNSLIAAQFDLDQCTFTVSVSKASSVFAGPADANFGVSFDTFSKTADVNHVTGRSW